MKILANDGLAANGRDALVTAGHEVLEVTVAQDQLATYIKENNVDVLLVRSATKVRKDLIDACPNLKMIGRGGVGMDNIDVEYAREKGITVFNTPASSSQSVAEMVMAHLWGMVRFLHDSNRQMPLEGETRFKELKKAYGKGIELQGKTLGIIGFGRIGQALAKMALGIGMNVIMHDRNSGNATVTLSFANGATLDMDVENCSMNDLLAKSDFISLHVSGAGETIIGADQLNQMKKGSYIVNTARGGTIDEVALIDALESGHIAGAALDVFVDEPTPAMQVLMNSKISLTPHIGAATVEAQSRIAMEIADTINEAVLA
ncbi:D-2-hydroxyacid dehydrogenase [Phaeocystidibacter marisrubri]|uniref:3-phosphoglycerate dehydrogenase n=1 Tax=Phaeocystidibacter marisrubri TaxID=1577780 RepID=A0A6L3ZHQ1_9FLAO|nr:D-2-hydroxyacid dehydrogenase [Phaeocystidibacter marisrubri]KAB2817015.1 3-phosphoglycerate dehydrogenase [Phaeocystidibacter marisrubri]GGH77199.1 3-phosphoglycerate dehydrogenase [Phaeocystidibacter marisrubri]